MNRCPHLCRTETFFRSSSEIDSILFDNRQRVVPHQTLYKILSLYENWPTDSGISSVPRRRQVLHYVATRAFWSRFNDSDCVGKLMKFLFDVDGHFGFLLRPRDDIFSHIVGSVRENRDRLLDFFLHHAYRQKLTFRQRRVADLDVEYMSALIHPCEAAVASGSPASLHVLLKYGAGSVLPGSRPRATTQRILLSTVDGVIACVALLGPCCETLVECGRLLLRACPPVERAALRNIRVFGYGSREEALRAAEGAGLTDLRDRLGDSSRPPSLKHLCRLNIRQVLHQNWQLPSGIDELQIPHTLKDYLNLESD